jgi:hypothetical membrane protein
MTRAPWWAVASATAAPVLLIGGWTLAAALQRDGFDQASGTISALAALDADQRWVMTAAIAGTGVAHMVTAAGLRDAAVPGRLVLAVGGAANLFVAAFPLPTGEERSAAHFAAATVGFGALALWPLLSVRRGRRPADGSPVTRRPWGLRPAIVAGAGVVLAGTLAWFVVELAADSGRVGVSERIAAGAQAIWPLAVVASTRVSRSGRQ